MEPHGGGGWSSGRSGVTPRTPAEAVSLQVRSGQTPRTPVGSDPGSAVGVLGGSGVRPRTSGVAVSLQIRSGSDADWLIGSCPVAARDGAMLGSDPTNTRKADPGGV